MNKKNDNIIKKKITLKSTLEEVLEYEKEMVELLNETKRFTKKLVFQVRLAFHEAIINIIVHTYKKNPDKKIDVYLLVDDENIVITIRDYGNPVDIAKIKSRNLEELKESGLGVHFYKTLMDVVEYSNPEDNSGNIIKMIKKI
ncbi:MAG: ATP-binding protein [bacterium]